MNHKNIILVARIISLLFTPFYLPLVALIALFVFSYLSVLPLSYKLSTLLLVYLGTVLMPTVFIHVYRNYQGWTLIQLGQKERRVMPYLISIMCYFVCYYMVNVLHEPHMIGSILVAGLAVQILCALINVTWKVSTHSAAVGGMAGGLLAFSFIFNFNPVWWLCLIILVGGLVGTSRMILRQHTLAQVVTGYFIGLLGTFIVIILV